MCGYFHGNLTYLFGVQDEIMTNNLRKTKGFDVRSGKIERYMERLEQYFEMNKIPSDTETSNHQRAFNHQPLLSTLAIFQEICRRKKHS